MRQTKATIRWSWALSCWGQSQVDPQVVLQFYSKRAKSASKVSWEDFGEWKNSFVAHSPDGYGRYTISYDWGEEDDDQATTAKQDSRRHAIRFLFRCNFGCPPEEEWADDSNYSPHPHHGDTEHPLGQYASSSSARPTRAQSMRGPSRVTRPSTAELLTRTASRTLSAPFRSTALSPPSTRSATRAACSTRAPRQRCSMPCRRPGKTLHPRPTASSEISKHGPERFRKLSTPRGALFPTKTRAQDTG